MKFNFLLRAALLLALLLPAFHVHADADGLEAQESCAICLHVVDDDNAVDQHQNVQAESRYFQTQACSITFSSNTLLQLRARAPPEKNLQT